MEQTELPIDQVTPQQPSELLRILRASNKLDSEFDKINNENLSELNEETIETKRREVQTLGRQLEDLKQRIVQYEASFETKRLMEELKIVEQYQRQVAVLEQAVIIAPGNHEITAIDGKTYKMPTLEDIAQMIEANIDVYKAKAEQGFTQLLLVPLGISVNSLESAYADELVKQDEHRQGLETSDGRALDIVDYEPVTVHFRSFPGTDEKEELLYYPKISSTAGGFRIPRLEGGQTKQQLIDSGQAWQAMLLEDIVDIPATGEGKTYGGRAQFEAGLSPIDYLEKLLSNPNYNYEDGLTFEAWLTLALQRVIEDGQILDGWNDIGPGKGCYLISNYFSSNGNIPSARWIYRARCAVVDYTVPSKNYPYEGIRSSVRIMPLAEDVTN